MATLEELALSTGISLTKLRKLEKLKVNFAKLDPSPGVDPRATVMRFHLMRNQQLTVAQILTLIDEPDLFFDLKKYEKRARAQIETLGDYVLGAAPSEVSAELDGAARAEVESVEKLGAWLRSALPGHEVNHYWIATRLLAPLNPFLRAQAINKISIALLNVRKSPAFAGYWRSDNSSGRSAIKYSQPVKKQVDTLDL